MRLVCPCPPIRNNVVTPRHLFLCSGFVRPSIRWFISSSVHWSVDQVETWETSGVWMGTGRSCPPMHNDIVTQYYLFFFPSNFAIAAPARALPDSIWFS